jgi:Na+-translocating ferredoxin:NAD+ oxidoreductase RnfD subunit
VRVEEAPAAPGTQTPPGRVIHLGGHTIPAVGPSWRDPRLHLAAVIVSLQVLGQVALHFPLSIAQIMVSILTCAILEVGITLWRHKILMWPASALLTGNGVALLLRVVGTRHGDWWSLHGAGYFALAAAISLLSKHLLRWRGRHVFNPSNLGLVVVFLAFGTRIVNPQDLWWGPMSVGLGLALALIVIGGVTIVVRLRMLALVAAFWLTFAAATGLVTASGHCMVARWSLNPVCGGSFWWVLALSPEILVFMFFMITDPKTTPSGRVAQVVYGAAVGFLAALAAAPAHTEFWTKVGVLSALVVICALRPLLERLLPAAGSQADRLGSWIMRGPGGLRGAVLGLAVPLAAAAALVAAGLPARPAAATTASSLPVPRPSVAVPAPSVPTPSIDPSVRTFDAAITQNQAQQMVNDLAEDLAIEAQALQSRDAGLEASAASGAWLTTVTQEIAAARTGGTLAVSTYTFTHLSIELVANPARPQDPPTLGVLAEGTLGTGTSPPGAYRGSFGLAFAGGHYLITGEYRSGQDS